MRSPFLTFWLSSTLRASTCPPTRAESGTMSASTWASSVSSSFALSTANPPKTMAPATTSAPRIKNGFFDRLGAGACVVREGASAGAGAAGLRRGLVFDSMGYSI